MTSDKAILLLYSGKPEGFDQKQSISYWQKLDAETRLNATWELAVTAWKLKGKNTDELRFQRSVALLKRI